MIFLGVAHVAFADMCDDFKSSVTVNTTATALTVKAGDKFSIPVKIDIDPVQAKRWTHIYMMSRAFNGITGSQSMSHTYILTGADGELDLPKSLDFQSSSNMGGFYKAGVVIYAQDKAYTGACEVNFQEIQDLKIELKNDPEKIDINPPVAKNIRFKKNSYGFLDTLEILFEADDKSEICSMWKAQSGSCKFGTHVELTAVDGAGIIAFHTPTPIFKTQDNKVFLAVVPLSEEYATQGIKSGVYKLTNFMFKDIYGNFFDEMPKDHDVTVEIREP